MQNSHHSNIINNNDNKDVIKKEAEKILKYNEFIIEIQCIWNV